MKGPIRLAIVDDYAVVVAGIAALLADERIDVVETGTSLPVISDVDVVLYDTFGQVQGQGIDLEDFVRESGAKVVLYSWNLHAALIEDAIAAGASGYLSKVLTGPAIVAALGRIMEGEIADRAYLSINSVKTYIRAAYRKIGVDRRTQAVIWGMHNGFRVDTVRTLDSSLARRSAVPAPPMR